MKSLYLKFLAPLFLAFFVLGAVQTAHAAFPGKTTQAIEVVANVPQPASSAADTNTILLVILCFLLPPLAVYLKYNEAGTPFIVNIILTLLFWLPGVIHALYHVLKK